jgi:hypothetical protein
MSDRLSHIPLQPAAWALAAALTATFIVCAGFELIAPTVPAAHGWVGIFTIRPIDSALAWVEGIACSIAFGWFFAAIGTWVFNSLARR